MLIQHSFPTFLVDLLFEEDDIVMKILLLAKKFLELGPIGHVLDDVVINGKVGSLIALIIIECLLDQRRGSPESEDCEKMMRDVVMEAIIVEEHVISFMVFLQKSTGDCGGLR